MKHRVEGLAASAVAAAIISFGIGAGDAAGATGGAGCRQVACPFKLEGTTLALRFGSSEIKCESVGGRGGLQFDVPRLAELRLKGCHEHSTPFHFSCYDGAAAGREATATAMETSVKAVDGEMAEVRLLSFRLALVCGGFLRISVEGFWVGRIVEIACDEESESRAMPVKLLAHGSVVGGAIWDVYLDADIDTYQVKPPWHMTFDSPDALCTKRA